MYNELRYEHAKIPKMTSDYWKAPTQELFDELFYFRDSRSDLEQNVWPTCARAYMCRRDLPANSGMQWVDASDLGETDIWDGVNYLSKQLVNNAMPRGEDWQQLLARNDEDQSLADDVRDYLSSLHKAADTRGNYEKHVKQFLIYGTSGISWRWEKRYSYRKYGPAEVIRRLQEAGEQIDPAEDFTRTANGYSFPTLDFNGPVIRPVEMYDLFLDPNGDLSDQQGMATITRTYWTAEDLKRARNEFGEPRFSNLEGLEPLTLQQIYGNDEERYEISVDLGINPIASRHYRQKYVPVYVLHKQIRQFEGNDDCFVDTYFYLASDGSWTNNRLIAVESNPNRTGARSVFIDTYEDWISGTGYGIGAVEKSLSAYNQKNVISALSLNASLTSVFPAYNVIAGMLQDDRKLEMGPGALNVINYKKDVGTNFIAPVPAPAGGVQLGQETQQWLGQKILGQMQAGGALQTDPSKTVQNSKTATQIDTESTSSSIAQNSLLEKMTIRSLGPLCQAVYDAARQWQTEDIIEFEKSKNGDFSLGALERDLLDKDRKVVVVGSHATMNKAAQIESMKDAINVLTTGNAMNVLPTGLPILQELVLRLLGRLSVPNMDQYKQDPVQLVMQDTRVQQELNQLTTAKAQEMLAQLTGLAPPQELNQPIPPPPSKDQAPPAFGTPMPLGGLQQAA